MKEKNCLRYYGEGITNVVVITNVAVSRFNVPIFKSSKTRPAEPELGKPKVPIFHDLQILLTFFFHSQHRVKFNNVKPEKKILSKKGIFSQKEYS